MTLLLFYGVALFVVLASVGSLVALGEWRHWQLTSRMDAGIVWVGVGWCLIGFSAASMVTTVLYLYAWVDTCLSGWPQ